MVIEKKIKRMLVPYDIFKEPEKMTMAQMETIMKKRGFDPQKADLSLVAREMAKKIKK